MKRTLMGLSPAGPSPVRVESNRDGTPGPGPEGGMGGTFTVPAAPDELTAG